MADQSNSNQTTMYILVGVVVLLAAVVGYMFYARNQPAATTAATTTTAAAATGSTTTGQQAAPVDPAAPIDIKTATKVTGADPKAFVTTYYNAVTKKDWATAYKLLPYSVKSQQDEASWGQTQAGYGIKGFTVKSSDIKGDTATVVVSMDTASYGTFSNTWTFKKVGDSWYVLNKKTAMGQ